MMIGRNQETEVSSVVIALGAVVPSNKRSHRPAGHHRASPMAALEALVAQGSSLDRGIRAKVGEELSPRFKLNDSREGAHMNLSQDRYMQDVLNAQHSITYGTLSDKLSKILEDHSKNLDDAARFEERIIRADLLSGFISFAQQQITLGRLLRDLRGIYKAGRVWCLLATALAEALGCSTKKLDRMIVKYENSVGLPTVRRRSPKSTHGTQPESTPESEEALEYEGKDNYLAMRIQLKADLEKFPLSQRLDIGVRALGDIAHEWNLTDNRSFTITPTRSDTLLALSDDFLGGDEELSNPGPTFFDVRECGMRSGLHGSWGGGNAGSLTILQ